MIKTSGLVFTLLIGFGSLRLAGQSHADETSTAILNMTAITARETQTLSADIALTWQSSGRPPKQMTGSVVLMKPNYALLRLQGDYPLKTLASNGTSLFTFPDESNYKKAPIDARGEKIDTPWWGMPFRYLFTQSVNPFGANADPAAEIRRLGNETIAGRVFRVVSVHGTRPMVYTAKLYFGESNILERTIIDTGAGETPTATFSAELTSIKINLPMTVDSFHFVPPANAKLKETSLTDTMLAIGEYAPDFTLPSGGGAELSLRSERQGMKATLINFWYLACAPCRVEFPEFEKLYQEFHAKGFNIVAVDKGDSAQSVSAYARKAGLTFPILLGGEDRKGSVFDQYRVSEFPGTYLLDAEGRIVYRATGADIDGLRRELKRMGLN